MSLVRNNASQVIVAQVKDSLTCIGALLMFKQSGYSVETLLEELYNLQCQEPELFRLSRYTINMKGDQDQSRVTKYFLQYKGPDEATVRMVEKHHSQWLRDPDSFWLRPAAPSLTGLSPETQIIGCYLSAKYSDA
ncbi:hypothetical protein MRB53_038339 [Persea americana]|nr:hypothetical protein MRB53_038339 [Persea americana]